MRQPKLILSTGRILPILFDAVSSKIDLQYTYNADETLQAGIGLRI